MTYSNLLKGLAVVAMAVVMVACGGVESKAESYAEKIAKATEAGDYEALTKLETEIEKYAESLSDEELDKFEEALDNQMDALIKAAELKAAEEAIKAAGEAVEALSNGEGISMEAIEKAEKEAEKLLENVSEEAVEKAEEAVEKAILDLLGE